MYFVLKNYFLTDIIFYYITITILKVYKINEFIFGPFLDFNQIFRPDPRF